MKRAKWALIGLLFAATAWAGWALRGDSGAAALAVALEAEELRAEGFLVAQEASRRELTAALDDQGALRAEIDRLGEALGARPRVREVTKWRTSEIEVPVDRFLPGACPPPGETPASAGTPSVSFEARGAEARLVAREGNTVATGVVELWKTKPPPEELLGTAAWQTPLSQILVATERRPTPWRVIAMLGATTDEQVEGGLVFHKTGRIGWYGRAGYALDPSSTSTYDPSSESYQSVSGDKWALAGGVAITLGRK